VGSTTNNYYVQPTTGLYFRGQFHPPVELGVMHSLTPIGVFQ